MSRHYSCQMHAAFLRMIVFPPAFLAELLQYMYQKSKYASVFKSTLPLAGREGSVSGFLKGNNTGRQDSSQKVGLFSLLHLMQGIMNKRGKSYVVVLIVNDAAANRFQIRKDMEYFLLSL